MPIPASFLTKLENKVYTDCLKCKTILNSTRGERTHLQRCCFEDILRTGQENTAPVSCTFTSGSKRSHSQAATSVASNSCGGSDHSTQQASSLRGDAVLQLEVTGGHVRQAKLFKSICKTRHVLAVSTSNPAYAANNLIFKRWKA